MKKYVVLILLLLFVSISAAEENPALNYYQAGDFSINFTPLYPLFEGEEITIRVKASLPASKVTAVFDNEDRVPMIKIGEFWTGRYKIRKPEKSGWHQLNVYFRSKTVEPSPPKKKSLWENLTGLIKGRPPALPRYKEKLEKRSINIRTYTAKDYQNLSQEEKLKFSGKNWLYLPPYSGKEKINITTEPDDASLYEEAVIVGTGTTKEASSTVSREADSIKIKGSRVFAFSSKSMEGSRESFLPGTTREESLRINVAGKIDGTEIDANFFGNSSISATQISTREEKVSVLLKRGSVEAYLGDFTADFNETEFTALNQVLSGVWVKAETKKAGFKALASTPQGTPKRKRIYGTGSQGPYYLDNSPVVVDSEKVYVNQIKQTRGVDYTIDYNAGTITFKSKVIISTSIIEVFYDYRQNVYQHSLYAFRGFVIPSDKIKIGATYIDDSDTLQNAESIQAATGKNPAGHRVFGIDSSVLLGNNWMIDSEMALSDKNLNLLSSGSVESGTAFKINSAGSLGPFGIKTRYKKINPGFETPLTAYPQKDLLDYGAALSLSPFSLFNASGSFNRKKYAENQVVYEITDRGLKAQLLPAKLPSLEYALLEAEDSNDPVTGSSIHRITTKNSLASNFADFGMFNLSAKAQKERRLYATGEAITYDTYQAGASTNSSVKLLTATANVEYKKTTEAPSPAYSTKTYDLKLSANPNASYGLSAGLNIIDDAKNGKTTVSDVSYKAEVNKKVSSDGKISITSVDELFASNEARVTKQTASLKFDLRPLEILRLRYYYKPNFTIHDQSGIKINKDDTRQFDADITIAEKAMLGITCKTQDNFTVDRTIYPDLSRIKTTLNGNSSRYTLKAAPLRFISTEFNYTRDNSFGDTLTSSGTAPATYRRDNAAVTELSAAVKTSLSQAFAIDSLYSHKTTLKGTGEAIDDATYAIVQTASLKGIWNVNYNWTLSATGAAALSRNLLDASRTYTLSPGAGFIFRLDDLLRIDGDYTYSRSFSAVKASTHKLALKAKYNLSRYVNVSLRYEREICSYPFYRTTDISGIVEIVI